MSKYDDQQQEDKHNNENIYIYLNYNDPQRQESRRPVQAGTLQFQAGPDCSDLRSRRRCHRSQNADSEIVSC